MAARGFRASSHFLEDLRYWVREEPRVARKVLDLMEQTLRDPQTGAGKPKPLRGALAGCWSRRITQEHRLVYRVEGDDIAFLQCRYHY